MYKDENIHPIYVIQMIHKHKDTKLMALGFKSHLNSKL